MKAKGKSKASKAPQKSKKPAEKRQPGTQYFIVTSAKDMPSKVHPCLLPMLPSEAVLRDLTTNDIIYEEEDSSFEGHVSRDDGDTSKKIIKEVAGEFAAEDSDCEDSGRTQNSTDNRRQKEKKVVKLKIDNLDEISLSDESIQEEEESELP